MEYLYLVETQDRKFVCYQDNEYLNRFKQLNPNAKIESIPLIPSEIKLDFPIVNNIECYNNLSTDQFINQLKLDLEYYKNKSTVYKELYDNQVQKWKDKINESKI